MDAKNRMIIPSDFRDELGNKFYIGIGFDDNYIALYAKDKFQTFIDKLMVNQMENWDVITTLSSQMNEIPMDAQGRITVPGELCSEFELDREIMVIGGVDHIQLWKVARWEAYIADQKKVSMKEKFKKKQ